MHAESAEKAVSSAVLTVIVLHAVQYLLYLTTYTLPLHDDSALD